MNRRKFTTTQSKLLAGLFVLLSGCATNIEYQLYVETQKALNKDFTMSELAIISALTQIVKESPDPEVKLQAIKALQELQKHKEPVIIERPKSWYER